MKVIHLLRKPLSEKNVASNALKHGTGGLDIDGSRIKTTDSTLRTQKPQNNGGSMNDGEWKGGVTGSENGRWPSNLILDGKAAEALDEQSGIVPTGSWVRPDNAHKFYLDNDKASQEHQEWKSVEEPEGGASRFFKQVK